MLVNHGPSQQSSKEEYNFTTTGHRNEVLPQNNTHLIQRPCYQQGSPCQDTAGNWTTWRSPDNRKEMQTAVVWSYFPFIRSGQNHLAKHSERGKKTRWTKEEVGRQHQGMDRPGVRQAPEGSGEQGKMEKTGCKIICGAQTTLEVKGLMMMMMMELSPWVKWASTSHAKHLISCDMCSWWARTCASIYLHLATSVLIPLVCVCVNKHGMNFKCELFWHVICILYYAWVSRLRRKNRRS